MNILQAIVLGILQGATEFIPVSSSGHLVLVPWLLGWGPPGLAFTVVVHLGTVVGVLAYFWREWWGMLKGVATWVSRRETTPALRLLLLLILGSIPAAVLGVLFKDFFEQLFETPLVAAIMLLVTAAVLVIGERVGRQQRDMASMTRVDSLVIGLAQALSIIPGLSRSGSTITGGRLRHLRREDAARFSFLLSTPVIVGAGLFQVLDLLDAGLSDAAVVALVAGFVSAMFSSYLVIRWLLAFLRSRPITIFAIYCAIAGLLSLAVVLIRG